jgi:hypothetical protein
MRVQKTVILRLRRFRVCLWSQQIDVLLKLNCFQLVLGIFCGCMHWPSNVKIDVLERLTCVKDVNTVNSSILVKVSKMSLPGNGIFVVRGEMCTLMTAMRRGARWSSHSHQDDDEPLMRNFQELKEILNKVDDLRLVQPSIYLSPFLEVIRSEETTGPVTSLALSAVNKFLSYGLIGKCSL